MTPIFKKDFFELLILRKKAKKNTYTKILGDKQPLKKISVMSPLRRNIQGMVVETRSDVHLKIISVSK